MRRIFYISSIVSLILIGLLSLVWPGALYLLIIVIPLIALGIYDVNHTHNILRNYPVIGHFRYMLEFIRPEIQQYFIASNQSGRPFNREVRSLVYQRAKKVIDTLPFGTQQDITEVGYINAFHSLSPKKVPKEAMRIMIGGKACQHPYDASRLNISAMSFGALGKNAIMAMNLGAKLGNFAQDTGEGGLSQYHLEHGGDIIWEIGSGYFGCRKQNGRFDAEQFKQKAQLEQVKMVEIKLSQGAKPSHGGVLPAAKITQEISKVRGVPMGVDCVSPSAHSEFANPIELLEFMQRMRELSGGKPAGFKLCIGYKSEFMGICKAMLETQILPDFIVVDGAEGGTGAAPIEFTNRLGLPINEALAFVHNCLLGINLRASIRVIASGKVASGFHVVSKLALGADACNAARAMMFAVGCIQALRCHTNTCPTGVTTQDPLRQKAIVVPEKAQHVANYHQATLSSFLDLTGAMGLNHPDELTPGHIHQRLADQTLVAFDRLYPYLKPGDLLAKSIHPAFADDWQAASAERF